MGRSPTGRSTWPWRSPLRAPATFWALWAGDGGEGAKFWLQMLTELKNRGVADVCMVVCDGLKGLPDAIEATWPLAVVQTCIIHLLRNSFRYAGRQHWDGIAKALRPVYTAPTEAAAKQRFAEFRRGLGRPVSCHHPVVGQRLRGDRAVPHVRHGDPQSRAQHARDRVGQRPDAPSRTCPRSLPQRGRRAQMRLPRRDEPRPDRARPSTLDDALETRSQRLRDDLRRTPVRRPQVVLNKQSYTVRSFDSPGRSARGPPTR